MKNNKHIICVLNSQYNMVKISTINYILYSKFMYLKKISKNIITKLFYVESN